MSPNAGGGGVARYQPMSTAGHRSPNKLWRSNSIFNPMILNLHICAAGFALLNLPKGKSLGRSKPATKSSNEQAH